MGCLLLALWALVLLGCTDPQGDRVSVDFLFRPSHPATEPGGHLDLTLTEDGRIRAELEAVERFTAFAFDAPRTYRQTGFSTPVIDDTTLSIREGLYRTAVALRLPVKRLSWTIGEVGQFTTVAEALRGTEAHHDFFLLTPGAVWLANQGDRVSAQAIQPATPPESADEPLTLALIAGP